MTDYNELPVHSPWAFTEDELRKANENRATYLRLKEVCVFGDEPDGEHVVVALSSHGYAHTTYRVVDNPIGLSMRHIALFCDDGNLCFGHSVRGGYIDVYTD